MRDRTNDVCRVPCSVPASSPSTSALPLQPTFAARIAQLRSRRLPLSRLCICPPVQVVAFNANLFPIIVPRLVAMHYTRTTPSSSIRLSNHPPVAVHLNPPPTSQRRDKWATRGRGGGSQRVPSGRNRTPRPWERWELTRATRDFCPAFLAAWIAPLSP